MSNPIGPATAARTETQGIRARKKAKKAQEILTPKQKSLRRILMKNASPDEKKAFDLGLESQTLTFLGALVMSKIVGLDDMEIPDRTKVTTYTKWFDIMRRITDRLDTGSPSIPDSVSLELVTAEELDATSDLPEVEGS